MEGCLFIFIFGVIPSVFSVDCTPENLEFRNVKEYYRRKEPFVIEIDVDRCPGEKKLFYSWEVSLKGHVLQTSTFRDIFIFGYDYPSEHIFELATEVRVEVSHNEDMSYSTYAMTLIVFEPEYLHLEIAGGPWKIHSPDEPLLMDGLVFSRDDSYPPHEDGIFFCKIFWKVYPDVAFPQPLSETRIPLAWPGLLKPDTIYNFTMIARRPSFNPAHNYYLEQTVSQIVEIRRTMIIPLIKITCVKNCDYPNYEEPLALTVNCVFHCQYMKYKFVWTIIPFIDFYSHEFGTGHDRLIIHEYIFKPGEKVKVHVYNGLLKDSITLKFADKIVGGKCYTEPKEGVSAVTMFKISCDGFYSEAGIRKYTVYQKFEDIDASVMLCQEEILQEKELSLSAGDPAVLTVVIEDAAFMSAVETMNVVVRHPVVAEKDLRVLVLDQNSYSVASLCFKQARNELIQTVSFVLDLIETLQSISKEEKRNLYFRMVKSLLLLEPYDFSSIVQVMSLSKKIQSLKIPEDTATTRLLADITKQSLHVLDFIMTYRQELLPPGFIVKRYLRGLMAFVSMLLNPVNEVQQNLSVEMPAKDYDAYDELVPSRLQTRDDLREVTECVLKSMEMISGIVLRHAFTGEQEIRFSEERFDFITGKVPTNSLPTFLTYRSQSKSRVLLPDELKTKLLKNYTHICYHYVVFVGDPFWWHKNHSSFTTEHVLFGLSYENKKIIGLPIPILLAIALKDVPFKYINGTLANGSPQKIAVHRILVEPKTKLMILFNAPNQTFSVRFSGCHCTPEDMVESKVIHATSSEKERMLKFTPEEGARAIFLCIMKEGNDSDLEYTAGIASFSCVYWNLEQGNLKKEAIEVSEYHLHDGDHITCKTSHLSFFTGQISEPEIYVNFPRDIEFYLAMKENWFMVSVVVILLLIWAILWFWAGLQDRDFKRKNVVCRLDDNVPGDKHIYLVVVFTGLFIDAGTTADVAFQIQGEESHSRIHLIKCCKFALLERNSQDWFIIYTPKYLGRLRKIRLWHNSAGSKPHWYCKRIIVQHLKSGSQYCFLVDSWLSLVWGTGKIYHEVYVENQSEMMSKNVLMAIKMENITEEHLWLSVVTRAPQSSFNSKERVSTAMTALFLSMLASALLFGLPQGTPSDSIDSQSKYFITFNTIVIFTESWLMSMPVILFIIFIFKNSAP